MGRRWIGVLAVSALLLLADVGDAKKEKKKKKKFFKEADLMCSACEEMVERVEWNLKDIRKKDEVAITEAMDGLCDNMTMYAFSKDFPRKFLRATGHAMETPDEQYAAPPCSRPATNSRSACAAAAISAAESAPTLEHVKAHRGALAATACRATPTSRPAWREPTLSRWSRPTLCTIRCGPCPATSFLSRMR
jgi:hypothetical protein